MLILLMGWGPPPTVQQYRVADVTPPTPQGTGPLYRVVDDGDD